jgi:hypothetical protein
MPKHNTALCPLQGRRSRIPMTVLPQIRKLLGCDAATKGIA